MFEFINKTIPNQKKECYTGNREYKRYLDGGSDEDLKNEIKKTKQNINIHHLKQIKINSKINKRATQLRYRLIEGRGKALYMIGVEDNGNVNGISMDKLLESIDFLHKMAITINATVKNIRIYKGNSIDKYICTVRIILDNYDYDNIL
jgi:GTPase